MKRKVSLITFILLVLLLSVQSTGSIFSQANRLENTFLTESDAALTDRLAILCKVWGFAKYHHPAVAEGKFDMTAELIALIPKITEVKNQEEENVILSKWVGSLGEITEFMSDADYFSAEQIKLLPDYSWVTANSLGEKLVGQIEDMKNARRPAKHYYFEFLGANNPKFKNDENYPPTLFPDTDYRLLALFKYWNIIQYFNPNRHLMDEDWNVVLKEFIPRFLEAGDEMEYKTAMLALIAKVSDSHANIWVSSKVLGTIRGGNRTTPLNLKFIEDKAVVIGFKDAVIAEETGLHIGDVIESIDGRTVEDIVKERLPLTPASNYPTQLREISRYLLNSDSHEIQVTYSRAGGSNDVTLKTYSGISEITDTPEPFQKIGSDITYVDMGVAVVNDVEEGMWEALASKGIIFDIRNYPNSTLYAIGDYLMPEPTPFVDFSFTSVKYPGLFTYELGNDIGFDNPDYYKGKVIIIVNEETQSHAEFTAMALRVAPNATVIGSTTSGADGNVSEIWLPGGIFSYLSGIGVYYPDGTETQRVGIIPDIEVKPTIAGIRNGIDEPLQKAIEIINDPLSVHSIASTSSVSIYPNPVAEGFYVKGMNDERAQVSVINMQGQEMLNVTAGNGNYVSIETLPAGVYIARIFAAEQINEVKIIKK